MTTIQQIENAIRGLSETELATFRTWYADFDGENWDRQFEADVKAGRLAWLAEEAQQELREGRCTER